MAVEGILIIVLIVGIVLLMRAVRIVRQHERGVVERFGKYAGLKTSGLTVIIPFVEEIFPIDMREQVINVDPQQVITKDNVGVTVDGVVYYKVVDPVKSRYEISNFEYACLLYTSDAADEEDSVDLGGRRIIKK